MGSCAPPAPFWLLLLLLPLQLPGTEDRPQGLFSRGRSGLKEAEEETCNSIFDLYFILDISGSIDNNWMDVYNFMEDLVKKFKKEASTPMPLTSDRGISSGGPADLEFANNSFFNAFKKPFP